MMIPTAIRDGLWSREAMGCFFRQALQIKRQYKERKQKNKQDAERVFARERGERTRWRVCARKAYSGCAESESECAPLLVLVGADEPSAPPSSGT